MNPERTLLINVEAVTEKDVKVVKSMLSLLNSRMGHQWHVAGQQAASDMCLSYQQTGGKSRLLMQLNNANRESFSVDYPLRAMNLKTALESAASRLLEGLLTTAADVEIKPQRWEPDFILQILQRFTTAEDSIAAPFALVHGNRVVMTVLTQQRRCYIPPAQDSLQLLHSGQCKVVDLVADKAQLDVIETHAVLPIEQVMWQLAAHYHCGKLFSPLGAESLYQLSAWPDFGALPFNAQTVPLAARLMASPVTLQELQSFIDEQFSADDLVQFLNAMALMGLLMIKAPQAMVMNNVALAKPKDSIFKRIRTRLGL